jgi:hypothetical protein
MLAGVKLQVFKRSVGILTMGVVTMAYHDRLAFVLNDVTGSPDFIATTEAQKHQFI